MLFTLQIYYMSHSFIVEQDFHTADFRQDPLPAAEFEHCSFTNCNFAAISLSGVNFSDCTFVNCDLSNCSLENTSLQEVEFRNCKLLGLRFDECNTFLLRFRFEECILNFSSFFKLKLKGIKFTDCRLEEVDFSETDLSKARFLHCNFSGAIFSNTILEHADLNTSTDFSIDPESNRITKARFSSTNIAGLLDKYEIVIQ